MTRFVKLKLFREIVERPFGFFFLKQEADNFLFLTLDSQQVQHGARYGAFTAHNSPAADVFRFDNIGKFLTQILQDEGNDHKRLFNSRSCVGLSMTTSY